MQLQLVHPLWLLLHADLDDAHADLDDDHDEPECLEHDTDALSIVIMVPSALVLGLLSSAGAVSLSSWCMMS